MCPVRSASSLRRSDHPQVPLTLVMRPLESILAAVVLVALAARLLRPRTRQTTASLVAMLGIFFVLHIVIDGLRWQMVPAYGLLTVAILVFRADLRRMSESKAGASARWKAVPSRARRAWTGVGLFVTGAVAVLLPGFLLPRVTFPEPAGYYAVGRLDVFWTDSSREETFTSEAGDRRGIWVTFWYPAEEAPGRTARYHPNPRVLASDLAAGLPLPGFAFWNLTAARTNSESAPPFNIREGRSPPLIFLHGVAGTRVQNTFEFETLASRGYVVVSIDHTYGSIGTVLPDGSHATYRVQDVLHTAAGRTRLIDVWTRDAQFVLDRLQALPVGDLSDTIARHLQIDRIGVFGHSLGGGAAAELMARDARVKAGVDMDGVPGGTAAAAGLHRPFLVFTSPVAAADSLSHAQLGFYGGNRDSVRAWYARRDSGIASLLRFGGTEVRMDGTVHASFTDLPLWSPVLARRIGIAGSDDPRDVHAAVTALTVRFFDQYLKGDSGTTSVQLPRRAQVRIIRHEPR
jgi:pimeloyl-ACP methyl ester carboxylesterase